VWDPALYLDVLQAKVVQHRLPLAQGGPDDKQPRTYRPANITVVEKRTPWFGLRDLGSERFLLQREWVDTFWAAHKGNLCDKDFVLAWIGTPGTGKTASLNALLCLYLKAADTERKRPHGPVIARKRYVALIFPNAGFFYVFDTHAQSAQQISLTEDPRTASLVKYDGDILVLHDLGKYPPLTPNTRPTVLATSPRRSKYKEFLKDSSSKGRYYTPLFSDNEMQFMHDLLSLHGATPNYAAHFRQIPEKHRQLAEHLAALPTGTATSWQHLAALYDNVPRLVFQIGDDEFLSQLRQFGREHLSMFNTAAEPTEKVDLLLAYISDGKGDCERIDFKRGLVAQAIRGLMAELTSRELVQLAEYTTSGQTFQDAMHEFWTRFATAAPVVQLHPNGALAKPGADFCDLWQSFVGTIKSERSAMPFTGLVKTQLRHGTYYKPFIPNYPLIDAFFYRKLDKAGIVQLLCFQMTIADEYKTTTSSLQQWVGRFAKEFVDEKGDAVEMFPGKKAIPRIKSKPCCEPQLQLHLVYVTTNSGFGYQELAGNDKRLARENLRRRSSCVITMWWPCALHEYRWVCACCISWVKTCLSWFNPTQAGS